MSQSFACRQKTRGALPDSSDPREGMSLRFNRDKLTLARIYSCRYPLGFH